MFVFIVNSISAFKSRVYNVVHIHYTYNDKRMDIFDQAIRFGDDNSIVNVA